MKKMHRISHIHVYNNSYNCIPVYLLGNRLRVGMDEAGRSRLSRFAVL